MKTKFIKAVEDNDILSVRISISNELMLDPRGRSFKEMLAYAESRLTNLYDEHDGVYYTEDIAVWNEEFLFSIKNDLDYNFSRERLEFYEKVAMFVLREKAENLDNEERDDSNRSFTGNSIDDVNETMQNVSKKHIYTGVLVAGAIATVAGICTSKAVLSLLGVAGIAVGGYLLYKEKK